MADISFHDEIRRKAVHLSSFWMPAVMILLAQYRWYLTGFFAVLTIGCLLVEHACANGNAVVLKCYNFFFRNMLRKPPTPGAWVISGGPPVLAAAFVTLLIFPPAIAAAAMALMLAGDTAAALVGRRFGRIRFRNGKSLEGSAVFILAGFALAFLFLLWGGIPGKSAFLCAFPAALAGMLAEFFEKKIHVDDNLLIPVTAGLVMQGILWILC